MKSFMLECHVDHLKFEVFVVVSVRILSSGMWCFVML